MHCEHPLSLSSQCEPVLNMTSGDRVSVLGRVCLGDRVQVRRDGCGDMQGDLVQIMEGEKASSSDQNVFTHHRVRV